MDNSPYYPVSDVGSTTEKYRDAGEYAEHEAEYLRRRERKTVKRREFITPAMAALMGLGFAPQTEERSKWIPQCFCGLAGDDVKELGEGVWKCRERHVFSEPWESEIPKE